MGRICHISRNRMDIHNNFLYSNALLNTDAASIQLTLIIHTIPNILFLNFSFYLLYVFTLYSYFYSILD